MVVTTTSDTLPPWLTPICQWVLVQITTGVVVAFAPAQSPIRSVAAIITAVIAYLIQKNVAESFGGTRIAGPVVAMCWVNVLNALDLLILSRVSYEAQMEWERTLGNKVGKDRHDRVRRRGGGDHTTTTTATTTRDNGILNRFTWSVSIAYNYRRINTPWQISRLPVFDYKNPLIVPSRTRFLLQSITKLVVSLLIVQLLTIDADPYDRSLRNAVAELSEHNTVFLSPFGNGISSSASSRWRVILVQVCSTISFGIVTRATVVAGYTLAGIMFVALGLSEPVSWPPIAGSLSDAWSLRRFWGTTWHQILRKLLTSTADFIASVLIGLGLGLGLPPKTQRHLAIGFRFFFAFLVSGTIHSLMDMAFGVPLDRSGGIWFFSLQLVGLAVEYIVQSLARPVWAITGTVGDASLRVSRGMSMSPWWKRLIGYVWVALFLLWVTPVWINPILVGLYYDKQRIPSPFLCFSGRFMDTYVLGDVSHP